MFRRRSQQPLIARIAGFFWPKNGWHRAGQYFWHRVHRLPGSPYSIAAGLATGAALSVTPLIGVHFFLAGLVAWMIRANVVASAIGTIVGNPWTFPVIWISTYQLGLLMLGQGGADATELNFTAMFSGLVQSMLEADGRMFMEQVWPIWMPMAVGSIPSAVITWCAVYFVFFRLTETYQHSRKIRRAKKESARLASKTKSLGSNDNQKRDAAV